MGQQPFKELLKAAHARSRASATRRGRVLGVAMGVGEDEEEGASVDGGGGRCRTPMKKLGATTPLVGVAKEEQRVKSWDNEVSVRGNILLLSP